MFSYACPQCQQQLTLPGGIASQAFRCPRCGRVSRPTVPDESRLERVAGYEILGELGRGGMGVVYKARQTGLNRIVALKMILDDVLASQEQRTRFRTEAEAVARLQHPHIVRIHEIGEHEGRPFFTLEFVGGGTLEQRLDGTPLPPRQAALLAEQLARAIHHAHTQGIIHRDLKPANVLLVDLVPGQNADTLGMSVSSRDGSRSSVTDKTLEAGSSSSHPATPFLPKIADFGLAKHLDHVEGPTGTGAVLGTPTHMAPEQARGDNKQIGPPADIWAVGATLYEMLTGRPPFRGAHTADTLLQVLRDDPVPPRQLQPKVPRELETICLKCLAKAPGNRYWSAEALADDLRRFLEGRPIQAQPVGLVGRMFKWSRRNPAAAASILVVVAGVVLLQIASLALAGYQHRQRLLAEELTKKTESSQLDTEESAREAARLAGLEADSRTKADKRRDLAVKANQAAQLSLASQALDRGLDLCANDRTTSEGLLWLARSLSLAQVEAPELAVSAATVQRAARLNLATWVRRLPAQVVHSLPHAALVEAAAVSPDGTRIATGANDGKVFLWDVASGRPIGSPLSHEGPIRCLAWSRSGKLLAVGTGDNWQATTPTARQRGEARVWKVETGKALTPPLKHKGTVWAVSLQPGDQRLLTGCNDKQARIWVLSDPQKPREIKHDQPVTGVAFFPDGQSFVTATCGNTWDLNPKAGQVQRWDLAKGERLGQTMRQPYIRCLAMQEDGELTVTGGIDGRVRFWDRESDELWGKELIVGGSVLSLGLNGDGSRIVTGSTDYRAKIYDTDSYDRLSPDLYLASPLQVVAITPDGSAILTSDQSSTRLWRFEPTPPVKVTLARKEPIDNLILSADARTVLTVAKSSELQLWNAATGQPAGKPFQVPRGGKCYELASNGRTILVVTPDDKVQCFDGIEGKPTGKEVTVGGDIKDVKISADGRLAVTGGVDHKLNLIDLEAGKVVEQRKLHNQCSAVAFAADGKSIATGTWSSVVFQFDVPSLAPIGRPVAVHGAVTCLALTNDGKRFLAAAHGPFVAFLGETIPGRTLGLPLRHSSAELAISPDARVAVTGRDDVIRMWDVNSSKAIGPELRHPGRSTGPAWRHAAFADDQTLVTARADKTLLRWTVPRPLESSPERLTLWVQARTGMILDDKGGVRLMPAEEWRQVRERLDSLPGPVLP